MTPPLEPPDNLHLEAAQGWLGLGSYADAIEELAKIRPLMSTHPEVLKVRWEVHAAEKKWEPALDIASTLIDAEPESPLGWIHRSYCLHELKRTQEARDHLLQVVERFPVSATIRYNLACYECQLGNLVQARKWLETAFRLGDPSQMKLVALADQDLEPLWQEIRSSRLRGQ